ncbi:MAG: hypothetical protein J6Q14_01645, partial [Oscillospiraceae bacterium]|nr:hypothetical protein [Oscillospiraceae bacterium]
MKLFSRSGSATAVRKRLPGKKQLILLAVILAIAAALLFALLPKRQNTPMAGQTQYRYDRAQMRDLTSTLTDSGALEPADSYTV